MKIEGGGLRFRNRHSEYFSFDEGLLEEDRDGVPKLETPNSHPEMASEIPGVPLERDQPTTALEHVNPDTDPRQLERAIDNADIDPAQFDASDNTTHNDDSSHRDADMEYEIIFDPPYNHQEVNISHTEDNDDVDDSVHREVDADEDTSQIGADDDLTAEPRRYPRRKRVPSRNLNIATMRGPSYDDGHIHLQVENVDKLKSMKLPRIAKKNRFSHIVHTIMMQLSLKKGLQEWGTDGEDAAIKEMKQHHDLETFAPVHA